MKNLLKWIHLTPTRIFYDGLGVPEPQAWKHVVGSTIPIGILLIPSYWTGAEPIPAIAGYPNYLNALIGICFLAGAISVLWAWWCPKNHTQSSRVKSEIRGLFFLAAGFSAIALLGLPHSSNAVFTVFISTGCLIASTSRGIILIGNSHRLLNLEGVK